MGWKGYKQDNYDVRFRSPSRPDVLVRGRETRGEWEGSLRVLRSPSGVGVQPLVTQFSGISDHLRPDALSWDVGSPEYSVADARVTVLRDDDK